MTDLPQPLTPADCDLRDFAFMPLDVVRLRDSELAAMADGDEFRCAVLLWCASWHQVPAASLPDEDKILAQYAGYGRVIKEWQKVRESALRGWVKCADGRLYHPVVAEKAADAWMAKLRQRLKTESARIKKHNERHGTRLQYPDFDSWLEAGCPVGQPLPVPSDNAPMSPGHDDNVTSEKHSKGQGEGQGQGQGELTSKPEAASQASTEVGAPSQPQNVARNVAISVLLRAGGIDATSQNPLVCLDWAENPKVTDELLGLAIVKARTAKPEGRIAVNYLKPIVAELLTAAEAKPKAQKSDDWAWKRSNQGIEAKGRELGMFARGGESYGDFSSRIQAELDKRKGRP